MIRPLQTAVGIATGLALILTLPVSLPAQVPAAPLAPTPSIVTASQTPEQAKAKQDAQAAALAWLKLVDDGSYAESWQSAADFFQKAVTQEHWVTAIKGVRPMLGAVLSRKVKSSNYATKLLGSPVGQYVVVEFNTEFADKKTAVETVTPMLAPDGTWKVSGYYMR